MALMRRWNMVLVLVATIALAAQPILHNHALIPGGIDEGGSLSASLVHCAFCAMNNARTIVVVPQLGAPQAVSAEFVDLTAPVVTVEVSGDLSSRAPPAAV